MSNTIQSSGPAPVVRPAPINLGTSPLAFWSLMLFAVGPGLCLLGALLASTSQGGAIIVVLGAIPWAIAMMYIAMKILSLLLTGGGLGYRRTKAAVKAGLIGVSYYVRHPAGDHVIVVDEARRLLCVNGDGFGFDDVKRLHWQSGNHEHRLDFILRSGAKPLRTADLGSRQNLKVAFERIGNTLGFS